MKSATIYSLRAMQSENIKSNSAKINEKWVPARPIGCFSIWHRFKCAWIAFTGKADLVVWPGEQ